MQKNSNKKWDKSKPNLNLGDCWIKENETLKSLGKRRKPQIRNKVESQNRVGISKSHRMSTDQKQNQ